MENNLWNAGVQESTDGELSETAYSYARTNLKHYYIITSETTPRAEHLAAGMNCWASETEGPTLVRVASIRNRLQTHRCGRNLAREALHRLLDCGDLLALKTIDVLAAPSVGQRFADLHISTVQQLASTSRRRRVWMYKLLSWRVHVLHSCKSAPTWISWNWRYSASHKLGRVWIWGSGRARGQSTGISPI